MNKTVLFCILYICSGCASKRDNIPTPQIASPQESQRLVITTNQAKNQYDQTSLAKTFSEIDSQIQQDASAQKEKEWTTMQRVQIDNYIQRQTILRNNKKVKAYYDANQ